MLGIALFISLEAQCTPCNVTFLNVDLKFMKIRIVALKKYILLLRFLIGQIMKINRIVIGEGHRLSQLDSALFKGSFSSK